MPSLAQDVNLRVPYQIYENEQLLTFFGLYDQDENLIEDVALEQIAIEFNTKIARPNSLTKFSSEIYGTSYVFLIDTSKSISSKNFNLIKSAIKDWVNNLNFADMAAIITFGDSVDLVQDFTFDKAILQTKLDAIERDSMNTRYLDALLLANLMLTEKNVDIPYRRVVVTLTDGLDDPDPSSQNTLDYPSVKSMLVESMVPYYMIGFAERSSKAKIEAINAMKLLSAETNGIFINGNIFGIDNAFKQTQKNIENVYLLKSSCFSCNLDLGEFSSTLHIDLNGFRYSLTQRVFVNEQKNILQPTNQDAFQLYNYLKENIYLTIVIGLFIFVLLVWLLFFRRAAHVSIDINGESINSVESFEMSEGSLPNKDVTEPEYTLKLEHFSKKPSFKIECHFTERIIIGRSSKADLVLREFEDISGLHAKIYLDNGRFLIDDLESTNLTFLNGARVIKKCPLDNGDLLKFGLNEFKVFIKSYRDLNYG